MLRRQRHNLTITPPPTRQERGDVAEYELLAALEGRDDAQAARLVELVKALNVTQTRITVAAMNSLQYGCYEANRRQVGPWLEAKTGQPWREAAGSDAGLLLLEAGLRWARIAAAVTAVEERAANRVTNEAGEWRAAEWPELADLAVFAEEVPGDLAGALDELVLDLNPGLFRTADQDADSAKKNGGISAG